MKRQNKRMGQVFLHDQNIINKILKSASPKTDDAVLEIGCGDGILSEALAKSVSNLTIIEIDEFYLKRTQDRLNNYPSVQYIHSDALDIDYDSFNKNYKIIANIPYQISAKLLQKLVQHRESFKSATLLVQKEFAKKCIAIPSSKDYTALTLFLQFHFDIKLSFNVSRNCFYPVPEVDSSVIHIQPKRRLPYDVSKDFFTMIKSAFWGRRKTLVKCLKKNPYKQYSAEELSNVPFLIQNPTIRGEACSIDDFYEIYAALQKL